MVIELKETIEDTPKKGKIPRRRKIKFSVDGVVYDKVAFIEGDFHDETIIELIKKDLRNA